MSSAIDLPPLGVNRLSILTTVDRVSSAITKASVAVLVAAAAAASAAAAAVGGSGGGGRGSGGVFGGVYRGVTSGGDISGVRLDENAETHLVLLEHCEPLAERLDSREPRHRPPAVDQQALEAGCSESAEDRRAADQQQRAGDAERYVRRSHD